MSWTARRDGSAPLGSFGPSGPAARSVQGAPVLPPARLGKPARLRGLGPHPVAAAVEPQHLDDRPASVDEHEPVAARGILPQVVARLRPGRRTSAACPPVRHTARCAVPPPGSAPQPAHPLHDAAAELQLSVPRRAPAPDSSTNTGPPFPACASSSASRRCQHQNALRPKPCASQARPARLVTRRDDRAR